MREQTAEGKPVQALTGFVRALRPADRQDPADQVRSLLLYLERDDVEDGLFLGRLLRQQLREVQYVHALTDAGIPSNYQGFWSELMRRISHRFLPDVEDPDSLTALLQTVFDREDDHVWISHIPPDDWVRLLEALALTRLSVSEVPSDMASALLILAHHVASLGLQPEITERLSYLEGPSSPFLAISASVLRYLEGYEEARGEERDARLEEARAQLAACREAVRTLRAEKDLFGTSLRLTILSSRLQTQIERLDVLLHLSRASGRDFQRSAVALLQALIRAVNTRQHVLPHLRQSADLLAYQVVEFAARKGSRYITHSPREYAAFLVSSMGGGLIVAVFALLKVLLDTLEVSLAAEAVLYGLNYSICFVLIYLTGATLATKQPAMTANTIARSIGGTQEHDIAALKDLVVRTWRSQFISFVGNLTMAFPVALLLAWGIHQVTGSLPAPPEKARALLEGLHPWHSGALAYAAVAGVFLFLAGLVSGYIDNRNRYAQIPLRVARHPWLRRFGGLAEWAGAFVDRNLGILVGNIFLGFCLGSSGTVGEILGLPFDIRHIAFASAHFGVAMEGLGWAVSQALVLEVTLGVMLIGLINFLVSFGLSLALAMESRQVTFREGRTLIKGLLLHLRRHPLDYFIPPRRRRAPEA